MNATTFNQRWNFATALLHQRNGRELACSATGGCVSTMCYEKGKWYGSKCLQYPALRMVLTIQHAAIVGFHAYDGSS
jgi:hypothetical protein